MKPHLPVRLFRAVALVLAVAPAALYADYTAPTEIVVPDNYTNSVKLSGAVDFATQTEATAYRLTGDVSMTPSGASFSDVSYLYTSDSADNLASISFTKPGDSTSLGLKVSTQVTFDCLNEISVTGFYAKNGVWGGAVNVGTSGNLLYSNNVRVTYSNNKVDQNVPYLSADGGALCVNGTVTFQDNKEVSISGNRASTQGGAIAVRDTAATGKHLVFNGNNDVTFTDNATSFNYTPQGGFGGALFISNSDVELNHNGNLTFSDNVSKGSYMGFGGAIYAEGAAVDNRSTVDISYNESLSFTDNTTQALGYNYVGGAWGGAIVAFKFTDVRLNGNTSIIFKGNTASAPGSNWAAEGGAISVQHCSSLCIQNNGSVIFEDNRVKRGNSEQYNSIYADDNASEALKVTISAPEEGSVEFRDCVYIDVKDHSDSQFNLNSKFTDENGNSIAQTGDIIFTGSYMTSGDKTSVFGGTATLNDGRLIVRDGAVLKADNLVIAESASGESTPTLVVDNGTIQGSITVNGGTVKGSGTLGALTMNGGDLVVGDSPSVQTYNGDVVLNEVAVTFCLADFDDAASAETQGWDSSAYSVIDMNGHNLTIGEDVTFTFEIGGEALSQLMSPSGEPIRFSLELFHNIDTLTLNDETIAELIAASEFIITSDEEGLQDGLYAKYAGRNITEYVTSDISTTEDGKVVLNVSMTTVPEPTTATLSLLALAALAARRRRR
ncbi:MAG: PEP-CTERM sorting domain-containing protein [Akkermansia sp.]|nr:PEP-CTERM sorting domain-containing protein [Akkermansia sp.]